MGSPVLQPTFTGGELSPSLYARVDLARYGTSVRTAKNFIVRPYGGLVNRPGTEFIREVKDSARRVRLLPFEYSSEVAYVIELGHLYARFIYRGAYVLNAGVPVEIVTPWTEDMLRDVSLTQSADVIYMAHESHQPIQIRRVTATSFEVVDFANKAGPFATINPDEAVKVSSSAALGTVTLTSNSDIFSAGMVGSAFYIEEQDLRGQQPWEAGWRGVTVGTLTRSDGKVYMATAVGAAPTDGWVQTGSIRPIHDSGRAYDGPNDVRSTGTNNYRVGVEWEYQHSGYGIVQITGYTSPTSVTGVVVSRIPASAVGGIGAPTFTWNGTGNGTNTAFSIASPAATSASAADYSVQIDGMFIQPNPYYTPPAGTGGGSSPGGGQTCVSVFARVYVVRDGVEIPTLAGSIQVGDVLSLFDHEEEAASTGVVSYSKIESVPMVRLLTETGAMLECSTTAPIPFRNGGLVKAEFAAGYAVPVRHNGKVEWSRVIKVTQIGTGEVQHITVGDRCFWAGHGRGDILHHNIKQMPDV